MQPGLRIPRSSILAYDFILEEQLNHPVKIQSVNVTKSAGQMTQFLQQINGMKKNRAGEWKMLQIKRLEICQPNEMCGSCLDPNLSKLKIGVFETQIYSKELLFILLDVILGVEETFLGPSRFFWMV